MHLQLAINCNLGILGILAVPGMSFRFLPALHSLNPRCTLFTVFIKMRQNGISRVCTKTGPLSQPYLTPPFSVDKDYDEAYDSEQQCHGHETPVGLK